MYVGYILNKLCNFLWNDKGGIQSFSGLFHTRGERQPVATVVHTHMLITVSFDAQNTSWHSCPLLPAVCHSTTTHAAHNERRALLLCAVPYLSTRCSQTVPTGPLSLSAFKPLDWLFTCNTSYFNRLCQCKNMVWWWEVFLATAWSVSPVTAL